MINIFVVMHFMLINYMQGSEFPLACRKPSAQIPVEAATEATGYCRSELKNLVNRLGLTGASIPLLLLGDLKFVPLTPDLDAEDRKVMENVTKLGNFLTGGDAAGLIGGSSDPQVMREMLPFLPNVATEIAPEVLRRLASRLSARAVRELFVSAPL